MVSELLQLLHTSVLHCPTALIRLWAAAKASPGVRQGHDVRECHDGNGAMTPKKTIVVIKTVIRKGPVEEADKFSPPCVHVGGGPCLEDDDVPLPAATRAMGRAPALGSGQSPGGCLCLLGYGAAAAGGKWEPRPVLRLL